MDLLLHFRAFVRVAELGGFSAAARALNASQPAVSRQVAELEAQLGARLLHRSSTGAALTEEGEAFLDSARAALEAADGAMATVGERRGDVAGKVRLGCSVGFGRLHIVPRLPAFLARHPKLSVELIVSDAQADLVQEGLDAAIRLGRVDDPNVVVRRIGMTRRTVVATPDYLRRAGEPLTPADLAGHECLLFSGNGLGDAWPFVPLGGGADALFRVPVGGRFRANGNEAIRAAVLAGMGLAMVPLWFFTEELRRGLVREVLTDWASIALPIQVLFPTRRQVPARVRALVEHLAAEFRLDPQLTDSATV